MKAHILTRSTARIAVIMILSAASLVLAGCFYMPGVSGRPAKAGVSIGRSLLPASVSSVAVIVGGPGMETIAAQYPVGTTSATLTVPSGVARTFTVLANTKSVTFRDDVTVDLAPDETKEIVLTPTLSASQIIIPDQLSGVVAQISDMNGTGWTAPSMPSAYDVDFDDQGRIYVVNSISAIAVMNDISDAAPISIFDPSQAQILSIAVDRPRGLLYWINYNGVIYRVPITPTMSDTPVPIDVSGVLPQMYSNGIAVDSDGFVYVAATSPTYAVLKIDPNKPQVVASSTYSFGDPWDVLVKGDFIYVSDYTARQIVRLTKNLDFVDSFSGPASDPFLGPERFVAILNKPITLIDEQDIYQDLKDRIVSFGDMTGAGWTTYGSTAPASGSGGPGLFLFFRNNLG